MLSLFCFHASKEVKYNSHTMSVAIMAPLHSAPCPAGACAVTKYRLHAYCLALLLAIEGLGSGLDWGVWENAEDRTSGPKQPTKRGAGPLFPFT